MDSSKFTASFRTMTNADEPFRDLANRDHSFAKPLRTAILEFYMHKRHTASSPSLARYAGSRECCETLGCGETSFWALTHRPDFPRPLRIGRTARWKVAEILAWADAKAAAGEIVNASNSRSNKESSNE